MRNLQRLISTFLAMAFAVTSLAAQTAKPKHSFVVSGDQFLLDGKPYQVISGEIHYERIPREYWKQRLEMAKAMGLNTIATYVFWNVHEPKPGVYDFSGNYDIAAFLRLAQSEHLNVLLRAGPYGCAEWEFGGFPAWLLADPKMSTALRANDPAFMVPAERWIKRLAQEVAPFQVENGGPIIATQVENEYGNFSNDHEYMRHMRDIFVAAGFNKSLLYTVDPSKALANGEIDGVYSGVNFGTGHAELGLSTLAKQRPGQPLFATEYWPGWFDLWGHPHETRPLAPQQADLKYMMSHNASVNIYMFHGGSSFGMMAGSSESTGSYRGNVTSYDYDAPLDEAGHPTPKFYAYRDIILQHTGGKPLPLPVVAPVITLPAFKLVAAGSLWSHLPAPITAELPPTMEQIGQSYGYILYRKQLTTAISNQVLKLDSLQDFAQVYLDGKLVGTLDRHYHQNSLKLSADTPAHLDILVENTGRLNSTKAMRDERKGIRGATLAGKALTGWQVYSLPMDAAPTFDSSTEKSTTSPHFAAGNFTLTSVGDSFLDVRSLGKGIIWINGHPLGRFWNIGPQGTLYVPAPWLKNGINRVEVFDMFPASDTTTLAGLSKPILDAATPGYKDDPEHTMKLAPDAEFGPQLAAPAPNPIQH